MDERRAMLTMLDDRRWDERRSCWVGHTVTGAVAKPAAAAALAAAAAAALAATAAAAAAAAAAALVALAPSSALPPTSPEMTTELSPRMVDEEEEDADGVRALGPSAPHHQAIPTSMVEPSMTMAMATGSAYPPPQQQQGLSQVATKGPGEADGKVPLEARAADGSANRCWGAELKGGDASTCEPGFQCGKVALTLTMALTLALTC